MLEKRFKIRARGTIRNIDRILTADAVATMAGALLGTSTTTAYIESGTGIAAGARTGLANVVTALLFLLVLPFTPLVDMVPAYATAPALVLVGVYMFRNVALIDFSHMEDGLPALLAIVITPLTYSISTGLAFGFLSYVLICLLTGKLEKLNPVLLVVAVLAALDIGLKML